MNGFKPYQQPGFLEDIANPLATAQRVPWLLNPDRHNFVDIFDEVARLEQREADIAADQRKAAEEERQRQLYESAAERDIYDTDDPYGGLADLANEMGMAQEAFRFKEAGRKREADRLKSAGTLLRTVGPENIAAVRELYGDFPELEPQKRIVNYGGYSNVVDDAGNIISSTLLPERERSQGRRQSDKRIDILTRSNELISAPIDDPFVRDALDSGIARPIDDMEKFMLMNRKEGKPTQGNFNDFKKSAAEAREAKEEDGQRKLENILGPNDRIVGRVGRRTQAPLG